MNELGPLARELIANVGDADGPAPGTRERVRAALGATIVASTALGSSAALGAQASAGTAAAAGAGFSALAAKGSAAIALWFVAGGAAGIAVATPLAVMAERPHPVHVAGTPPAEKESAPAPRRGAAPSRTAPAAAPVHVASETAEPARAPVAANAPRKGAPAAPPAPAPAPSPAPAGDVATELALLKAAQHELNGSNAAASLDRLDDHARRYPDGALKAERLAARVFALCQLGRVEEARAAAAEFLRLAADSPLVPRVQSSCGGQR